MKLRYNILLIALGVFILSAGIIGILAYSVGSGKGNDFLMGALLGLIGTSLTALTSLGNNILEKDNTTNDSA